MTLTVRLDTDLEKRFTSTVRRQRRSKSEVVTELLTQYLEAREPKSAYQVAQELGVFDQPVVETPPDLARNHKKYLLAAYGGPGRQDQFQSGFKLGTCFTCS